MKNHTERPAAAGDLKRMPQSRYSTVERRFTVPAAIEDAWEFFSDPSNLDSVTPSWFNLTVLSCPTPALAVGAAIDYRLRWRRLPMHWQSVITAYDPPILLTYEQRRGPYRYFRHEHFFRPHAAGTEVLDRIEFTPPARRVLAAPMARELKRILDYRAVVAARLLAGSGSDSRCQTHPAK